MLTSKQRAYLRSLANCLEPIFQVGKGGVNPNQLRQISDALEKRELIKIHVLENSLLDARTVCNEVADSIGAEPVQVIGKKFVIYKESVQYKTIDLKDADLSDTAKAKKAEAAKKATAKAKKKVVKPNYSKKSSENKKNHSKSAGNNRNTFRTRRSK
ncbi:MAG: ribosome assembly RNA-binding protein YhbY [Ruminococcaceae bacterium]|nr:ribosome assembly RNA-binding protein YhbY [Oscillospiraceae bacterium]